MSLCVFNLTVNMLTACITNGQDQYFKMNARLLSILQLNVIFIAKVNA